MLSLKNICYILGKEKMAEWTECKKEKKRGGADELPLGYELQATPNLKKRGVGGGGRERQP